ncbi:MAG TPA: hypothetical protein VM936_11700 [Pyrinomonadaceae bacterium]|nr:hypothetical protein [Pyrinomonadaceae bacterium]
MKKQIMGALAGFALTLVMTASVYAQAGRRVRVHVPFDFVVAGRLMPAGDYSVRRVSKDSENALLIQSADGRKAATVFTNASGREANRAELGFRQQGESYFLAEVSIPGTAGVREIPRSKSEEKRVRELIEQATAGGDSGKTVTVAGSVQ